ncbi:glycosyltransferase family 4 protein [Planctomycetota bacterium]
MRIVQAHNYYRYWGGEDGMFESICRLLVNHGQDVLPLVRDSKDLNGLWGRLRGFAAGIYSVSAKKALDAILTKHRPDILHLHNPYPLLSPSILVACKQQNVPVVMRCPNYRLICPISLCYVKGEHCHRCETGSEMWCVLKNCRDNIVESLGYALRAAFARKLEIFEKNITLYMTPSEYVRKRLVGAGYDSARILVLPNTVSVPDDQDIPSNGKYVAYAGRMSSEKGIPTLLKAADRTGLSVHLAGDHSVIPEVQRFAPARCCFRGQLRREELFKFYRGARFVVIPSLVHETFGLVVAEAMSHGLPVIASRVGGIPEIVDDGVTGLLVEPDNPEALASKMQILWDNPELCRKMGQAGRAKVIREYTEDVYYQRLMAAFELAIEMTRESIRGQASDGDRVVCLAS